LLRLEDGSQFMPNRRLIPMTAPQCPRYPPSGHLSGAALLSIQSCASIRLHSIVWASTAIAGKSSTRGAAVGRRNTREARTQEIIQDGLSLDGVRKEGMDACRSGEGWVRGWARAPWISRASSVGQQDGISRAPKEAFLTLCRLALRPREAERAAVLGIERKEVGR
jgi:hypothetical protein